MEIEYKGTIYKVGDKIKFQIRHYISHLDPPEWFDEYIGILKFGIYRDNERYVNDNHLGFYVEYKHKFQSEDDKDESFETLPDVIDNFEGELVL